MHSPNWSPSHWIMPEEIVFAVMRCKKGLVLNNFYIDA